MVEDVRGALKLLGQAMAIEREGREFYLKAAQTTQDERGRETFAALGNDEEKHYALVKKQMDSLNRAGKWVTSSEKPRVGLDLSKPIFPKGKEALEKAVAASARSSDWDALLFGLDIETRSYELYQKGASETSDPAGRRTFEFLAGQEQTHFELLMMRLDALFGPVSWQS